MSAAALIGVDWGTSRARAYRIARDGAVIDARNERCGVQNLGGRTFAEAFDDLIGDWRTDPLPRIAAGMIGSRQGWIDVPYVTVPATLAALAQGIRLTPGSELAIIPGVLARDPVGTPDVIRGEDTELFGALDNVDADALLVMPGTHSKWVCARNGAIAHDFFAARSLVLTGELASTDVANFLSGLLIGREVRDGQEWARDRGDNLDNVLVVGADALSLRYTMALARAGITSRSSPAAAARGLFRIARAAPMIA